MTPLYLRDLSDMLRAETENEIRGSGDKKLIEAMEAEEDIKIGYFLPYSKYKVA